MQVFISWSGATSREIAGAVGDWLERTIQTVDAYHSDQMEKGSTWRSKLIRELKESGFGLACLTEDNLEANWLQFEAGALVQELEEPSVSPILFHVDSSDVEGPLATFEHTDFEKEDMLKLVNTINGQLKEEEKVDDEIIEDAFDKYWSELKNDVEEIYESTPPTSTPEEREPSDMLKEILENTREISRRMARTQGIGHSSQQPSGLNIQGIEGAISQVSSEDETLGIVNLDRDNLEMIGGKENGIVTPINLPSEQDKSPEGLEMQDDNDKEKSEENAEESKEQEDE